MATTPHKPNQLHEQLPVTPASSKVELPHMPAKPEETPVEVETSGPPLPESTKAEMEAGRKALETAGQQTKEEMAAGAKAIGKTAPESTTHEKTTPESTTNEKTTHKGATFRE